MSKVAILYQSNYGTTKQYAIWLKEKLNADLYSIKEANSVNLSSYDTLIFGGSQFGGTIFGIKEFKKILDSLEKKTIFVFSTGLTDPQSSQKVDAMKAEMEKIVCSDRYSSIPFFYLRGGVEYSTVSFLHKMMLKAARSMMKKEENANLNDPLLKGEDVNYLDPALLEPIIHAVTKK